MAKWLGECPECGGEVLIETTMPDGVSDGDRGTCDTCLCECIVDVYDADLGLACLIANVADEPTNG